MEILNPEENANFTDHYLDFKFDFSKVNLHSNILIGCIYSYSQ
jgi:ATP-dependent Lon protease